MRQRDVHLLTGIAQSHISDIEAGTCNMAIDTMVKLATVVKTPLWRLFKPAADAAMDEDLAATDEPRRAPRSRQWYDENVNQMAFDFSAAEMRHLRKAAAEAGMTVGEFLRKVLHEAGVLVREPVS